MKTNENDTTLWATYKKHAPGFLLGCMIGMCWLGATQGRAYFLTPLLLAGLVFIDWLLVTGFTKRALRREAKEVDTTSSRSTAQYVLLRACDKHERCMRDSCKTLTAHCEHCGHPL